MAQINYEQALEQFENIFNGKTISYKNLIFETRDKPIEAYRIFQTKEAAELVTGVNPDSGQYEVYPGAVVSVVNDPSAENNGLYHVVYNDSEEPDHPLYKLNKYYDANTVDSLLEEFGGQTNFINVEDEDVSSQKLVYFTGVDKSTTHTDSSMYIVPTIAYDKDGTLFSPPTVHSSDVRLKDHIEELDVDLGKVGEIDKVKFTWKDNMNGKRQIGTTAQSLETIFPELVYTNPETGYKAVNYEGLSVIALAAVDKLYARVRELENTVRKLTKEQQ